MRRVWGLLLAAALFPSCSSTDDGPAPANEQTCSTAQCLETPRSPSSSTLPDAGPTTASSELTVTLDPAQFVLKPGASVDVNVTVTRPADLVEPLALEVAKLPLHASATAGTIPGDRTAASFRLTLGSDTPHGTYTLDVTARGASKVATARLPLSVIGAPGALDTSFGTGGRAASTVDFVVANLGLQTDGHIVLGGTMGAGSAHDHVAVRFDAQGVVDTAFGTAGKAVADYTGDDYAMDMIVQHDGKIALGGYQVAASYAQLLTRFNADGTLDTTFATTGKVTLSPSQYNFIYGLHEQADGKLIASGNRWTGADYNCSVTRFTAQGALDTGFGTGGYATLDMGSHDYCLGLANDAQSRIVVTGERYNGTGYDLVSGRFTSTGTVDTATFNSPTGWANSVQAGALIGFAWSVVVQPDSKVLVGGAGPGPSTGQDFVLFRYGDDGKPDATFGTAGKAAFDVGTWDRVYRLAIDSLGRIIVVGSSANDATSKAVVMRLLSNGLPDTTFGQAGRVLLDFSPGGDFALGLALLPDGRMLIGGYSLDAAVNTAWVARLWP